MPGRGIRLSVSISTSAGLARAGPPADKDAALAGAIDRGHAGRMSKIWFGLHLPNYTFPDRPPEQLFDAIVEQAKAAEAAGFGLVTVMDHLNQIPGIGQQDEPMLEAWSVLAALARETKTVRLGTLVTGVTYRNPALLAKTATTLDVISGGRAIFGLGAAWFEAEHDAFGFEFPPIKERMDRLDEALTIAKAMFTQDRPTFEGRHYQVTRRPQRPAADPGGRPADPRRRGRRAADAQDRRQARRHDALVPARPRDAAAQEGRPRPALRGDRPRPRRRSSARWRRPSSSTRNDAERDAAARPDPRGPAAARRSPAGPRQCADGAPAVPRRRVHRVHLQQHRCTATPEQIAARRRAPQAPRRARACVRPFRFLAEPGDVADGKALRRGRPPGGVDRLRRHGLSRPRRAAVRARAAADDGRRRHRAAPRRRRSSSTTTSATRRCSPRTWRRST